MLGERELLAAELGQANILHLGLRHGCSEKGARLSKFN
jgi:hypothetical protein